MASKSLVIFLNTLLFNHYVYVEINQITTIDLGQGTTSESKYENVKYMNFLTNSYFYKNEHIG